MIHDWRRQRQRPQPPISVVLRASHPCPAFLARAFVLLAILVVVSSSRISTTFAAATSPKPTTLTFFCMRGLIKSFRHRPIHSYETPFSGARCYWTAFSSSSSSLWLRTTGTTVHDKSRLSTTTRATARIRSTRSTTTTTRTTAQFLLVPDTTFASARSVSFSLPLWFERRRRCCGTIPMATTTAQTSQFSTTTTTTSSATNGDSESHNNNKQNYDTIQPSDDEKDSKPKQPHKIIVLAGPTAVGKSKVAAHLVQLLSGNGQGEGQGQGIVISADSVQTYQGVHIGANKPTWEERAVTPHLLVDMVPASLSDRKYSVAEWRRDALYAIQNVLQLKATHGQDITTDSYFYNHEGDKVLQENSTTTTTTTTTNSGGDEDDENDSQNDNTTTNEIERTLRQQEEQARRQLLDEEIEKIRQSSLRPSNDDGKDNNDVQPMTPIVVGGTMMYVQWLVYGIPDALQPSESAQRQAQAFVQHFRRNSFDGDWDGAVQHLIDTIPSSYSNFEAQVRKISSHDWYRLGRIMQVAITAQEYAEQQRQKQQEQQEQQEGQVAQVENDPQTPDEVDREMDALISRLYSGERLGGLKNMMMKKNQNGDDNNNNNNDDDTEKVPLFDVRCFFLCPTNRMAHFQTIDLRCEQMIQQGLLRETMQLAVDGKFNDMTRRAIGYRQALEYLQRPNPQRQDAAALVQFMQDFCTATRNYAAQQMKWYRKDDEFVFVPVPTTSSSSSAAVASQSSNTATNKKPGVTKRPPQPPPVLLRKEEREDAFQQVALDIHRMVQLDRDEFDREERLASDCPSSRTREENQEQGKDMKWFQFKRKILVDNSPALWQALQEADWCTEQYLNQINKNNNISNNGNDSNINEIPSH